MKESSRIIDQKISATNIMYDITIEEYVSVAEIILKSNILQRNRVKSSKTIYSLLREDLMHGCVLPPIVLATSAGSPLMNTIETSLSQIDNPIILDGLQRTYTIIDLYNSLKENDKNTFDNFKNKNIRLEIYFGINKFGILYRMLTLNSGQTPMSVRHQIEILYSDRANNSSSEIKFIAQKDDITPKEDNEYNLRNVVDGFQSYIDRNELPMQKEDILENIKSLEKLSKENQSQDLFDSFIISYDNMVKTIRSLTSTVEESDTDFDGIKNPYGKDINNIFKKSQTLTGFGAAVGKLIDRNLLVDFTDLIGKIHLLTNSGNNRFIYELNHKLASVSDSAKKIGNAQRLFFLHYFRVLLNTDSDSYLDIYMSIEEGYKKYNNDLN